MRIQVKPGTRNNPGQDNHARQRIQQIGLAEFENNARKSAYGAANAHAMSADFPKEADNPNQQNGYGYTAQDNRNFGGYFRNKLHPKRKQKGQKRIHETRKQIRKPSVGPIIKVKIPDIAASKQKINQQRWDGKGAHNNKHP